MLGHRLQILIDDDRYQQLAREASRRGVSIASIVRDAIDARFGPDQARRARALRAFLDAEPHDVPDDPMELKRQIADARAKLP